MGRKGESRSPVPARASRLVHLVGDALPEGFVLKPFVRLPGGREIDALVEQGAERWALELKVMRDSRLSEATDRLAAAVLMARTHAREARARPVALLGVPVATDRLVTHLRTFMDSHGEGCGWGVVDDRGRIRLFAPGLEVSREPSEASPVESRRTSADLFSDLNQWLLKVLLSHHLAQPYRVTVENPGTPLPNTRALARTGGTSMPTASRFVTQLRTEGFLPEGKPLRPIRIPELLRRWRAVNVARPAVYEAPVRWIFRKGEASTQLESALIRASPDFKVALGLFAACDAWGFRFVAGVAPHIYVEDVTPELLGRLGLMPCERGERVDAFVRVPRFPETVFRGAAAGPRPPRTDILQCWLDVSDHPARGAEMAEVLRQRVLLPSFGSDAGARAES